MSTLIPINSILANPEQPRKYFDQVELTNLAQSIREYGILEPLLLEAAPKGMYIIHDGERRFRAAKLTGLTEVPAEVTASLDGTGQHDRLERALICNIQRSDLSPIEEAQAYARLVELGQSVNRIAVSLGISQARISNGLHLLELEKPIQELIGSRKLSKDKRLVDALLAVPSVPGRIAMAKRLADRHATIPAGVAACQKLTGQLSAEKIAEKETPALRFAVHKSGEIRHAFWNALAQVGKLPPWQLVEISARDVCKACSLRDLTSKVTCRACPLVEMLVMMIGSAK